MAYKSSGVFQHWKNSSWWRITIKWKQKKVVVNTRIIKPSSIRGRPLALTELVKATTTWTLIDSHRLFQINHHRWSSLRTNHYTTHMPKSILLYYVIHNIIHLWWCIRKEGLVLRCQSPWFYFSEIYIHTFYRLPIALSNLFIRKTLYLNGFFINKT